MSQPDPGVLLMIRVVVDKQRNFSFVFGGLPEPNRACLVGVYAFLIWNNLCDPWAPARGGQGGQPPTLEKIRVGHAHPGNINRGLKTFRQ